MEKKEFPKKELPKKEGPRILEGARSRISGISDKLFGIIKFVLGVCLLPFVYSISVSFLKELGLIDLPSQSYFWAGIITFLLIHLFVFEPAAIYRKGHRLLEVIFSFFSPLVKVAPFVLPVYAIIVFILYLPLSLIFKSKDFFYFFLFIFSFSVALHLVFSAKSVRTKQNDFLKANYIFGFSFIFIVNLILLSLSLSFIFKQFSFVNFFNSAFLSAESIFYAVFKQLFL